MNSGKALSTAFSIKFETAKQFKNRLDSYYIDERLRSVRLSSENFYDNSNSSKDEIHTLYRTLSLMSSAMTVVPAGSTMRVASDCIALSNWRKPCCIASTMFPALYSSVFVMYS